MKKILGILFILFVVFALNVQPSFAETQQSQQQYESTLKDVYAYKIKGQNYKDVYNAFLNYFGEKAENAKVPQVQYAFLGTKVATGSHITFTAIQYKENRKPLHFSFTRNGETFGAAL